MQLKRLNVSFHFDKHWIEYIKMLLNIHAQDNVM